MTKYYCNCGKQEKEISKATIIYVDGKWVTKEALCDCGKYMESKPTEGIPNLIRTEPSLKKNGVRNYQRYLKKNGRENEAKEIDKGLTQV